MDIISSTVLRRVVTSLPTYEVVVSFSVAQNNLAALIWEEDVDKDRITFAESYSARFLDGHFLLERKPYNSPLEPFGVVHNYDEVNSRLLERARKDFNEKRTRDLTPPSGHHLEYLKSMDPSYVFRPEDFTFRDETLEA